MKYILIFVASVSIMALLSCEDNITNPEAIELTVSELKNDPGFADFLLTYTDYALDQGHVKAMEEQFDSGQEEVVIFVKPSCSCFDTQTTLPTFVKALDSAGIPSASIRVYSMAKEGSEHPLMDNIIIRDLPEFHIMRDGQFVYSILDSMKTDTLQPVEYWAAEALRN